MACSTSPTSFPTVPAKHADFISYVASHPQTSMWDLIEPYKQYDAKLREVFAREPCHPALSNHCLNVVPVFGGHESDLKVRARKLDHETEQEKEKYIMPLNDADRKPDGSPAVVQSLKEFQTNFALFSESSLVDLDWSNVVAAGSSVVTAMLPVPEKYRGSKRALRQYYHEIIAPASDVDLFLYGLTEEEAIVKIKQIETKIRDSTLQETTTIRTKNAITIASQYPTRHVQIVLRIYKSISEILTGFDVDCSCAAYDGHQVYASPRALAAYMTQINTIDLTRRSPSYENRLSKYSRRGFEIYWPCLDRSRIDPTIFERSFARTVGLGRLLILEKLPTSSERENYLDQRRRERGRPAINRSYSYTRHLRGNLKDRYEDEVAEWVNQEELSDYHTFTIPYGERFHAKKIEKLLYTKDLLLNAEWNQPKDREVYLHRHPAFFGYVEDVIHDCCGYCPKPVTPEEEDVAEQESKTYVSGDISFIKDDPGRQTIGSFNPITDDDWTEMAYVGNTARLCKAIVDGDLEHVQDWLAQDGANPNRRDYTGRTPLHLAVLSSTPETVRCLVDHGARLVWRLADGRTALHLAASRGNVQMVKILLEKSEANEEEEARKEDLRKQARAAARRKAKNETDAKSSESEDEEDDDGEMIADEISDDEESHSRTTGSFVKVSHGEEKPEGDTLPNDNEDGPDFYDINLLAWDAPCSPLHLAILNGNTEVVKELVQNYGADVLLPIKLLNEYDRSPRGAILNLVLALTLPIDKAKEMSRTLLELGASPAQADINHMTALHYFAGQGSPELMDILLEHNLPAVKRAINHLSVNDCYWKPRACSPLTIAIESRDVIGALKILDTGANPTIGFGEFMESYQSRYESRVNRDPEQNRQMFLKSVEQPVMLALQHEQPSLVLELLSRGAEPNTLTAVAHSCILDQWQRRNNKGASLLDVVRQKLDALKEYVGEKDNLSAPEPLEEDNHYLKDLQLGTYKYWVADRALKVAKCSYQSSLKSYQEAIEKTKKREGFAEKKEAVKDLLHQLEEVEADLLRRGAKTFDELYPTFGVSDIDPYRPYETPKPVPFNVKFSFKTPDLTDARRDAYLDLYEAAWAGDLHKIKTLTLAPWGPENDQVPLKIAIQDLRGFSPFAIAILRGHLDLAKAVLEIALAQYQPEKQSGRERYSMHTNDSSDYSDYDSEEDDDDDRLHIFSDITDDQFTIDNIGEVSTQVKSDIKPLSLLSWPYSISDFVKDESGSQDMSDRTLGSLLQYAIWADNIDLLVFLLQLGAEYTSRNAEDDDTSRIFPVTQEDLDYAIRLGRTRALAELIKRTGAGIPLEDLVKKSGVEVKEKPKYYQGLSVHGKKRKDWAAAGRRTQMHRTGNQHPPLLIAAFQGSIGSVEWFLSDAPSRLYSEFAVANQNEKRLKNLFKAAGGFNNALSSWLSARIDLIVHCVVLSKPSDDSIRLLQYLLNAVPTSLEAKSSAGHTPLHLAFSLRRLSMARALIDAGADQATRDLQGNNLVHTLLCPISGGGRRCPKGIGEMLSLIDKRLHSSLVTERTSAGPGAATPLALWLDSTHQYTYYSSRDNDGDSDDKCTILGILLSFSPKAEELESINGAGDTPLHVAIRLNMPHLLKMMLDKRPELLYRENATGRTPLEMAQDSLLSERVARPPQLPYDSHGRYQGSHMDLVERAPESFTEKSKEKEKEKRTVKEKTWEVCEVFMKTVPGKRRLVSLFDANEVAKRLASRQGEKGLKAKLVQADEDECEEVEEKLSDEVETWYNTAAGFESNEWKNE